LLDAFATVEREHAGAGTHEKYLQVANELADRYGVAKARAPSAAGQACACGH
jgi:hypothetical protein